MNKLIKLIKKNKWLIIIILLGSLLRFFKIDFQEAWLDEMHTLKESNPNLSFSEFHETIMFRESIPHFYFLIVRMLFYIFGHKILIARILSFICGVLLLPTVYKLSKLLYNKEVACFALTITAFHPFLIEYSQEARSYSMLVLFITLSVYYVIKLKEKRSNKNAFLLGVFLGLSINSHPLAILNVGSIYLLLLFFIMKKDNYERRIQLIRKTLLSVLVAFLVAAPVMLIFLKLLNGKGASSWIPNPSFESFFSAMLDISGYSLFLLVLYFIAISLLVIKGISNQIKKTILSESSIILLIWFFFYVLVLVVFSKEGKSLILHRYFISVIPALIVILSAVIVNTIKNKSVKNILLVTIVAVNLYTLFSDLQFYYKRRKSQFYTVVKEVTDANQESNSPIISKWAWLLSVYSNDGQYFYEKELESHLGDMMEQKKPIVSFWYIDGNSRDFNLTNEQHLFVAKNFKIDKKIKKHDAWAYHFKSNQANNIALTLNNFKPSIFDNSGAMIFVQNGKSKYPPLELERGNYTISFTGISLPEIPINNENAHFNLYNNNLKIGDFSLNNKVEQKENIKFFHNGGVINLVLEYDNDVVINDKDRNAILSSIFIQKTD